MNRSTPPDDPGAILIQDVAHALVVVGDRNIAVQVNVDGTSGYSDRVAVEPLRPTALPLLNPRRAADPVQREALVTAVEDALRAGGSVQLCGTAGVGKTAVAEAVARRLAAAGRTGLILAGGRSRDHVETLYTELARAFFSVAWYDPDEAALRVETARHRPSGVIVVPDCGLSAEDAERLLGTFPDCLFLLCSPQQSLYSGETVLDVRPLDAAASRTLVERMLGRPLAGLEHVQVQRIHELSDGRVSRLLVCAAFLKRVITEPGAHPTVPITPAEQAAVLIDGVSEPARRVLMALAAFGPAPIGLFDALTGLDGSIGAADGLEQAGLVERSGETCSVTEDVRGVLAARGWTAPARIAADGFRALISQSASVPDPRVCLAVAGAVFEQGAPGVSSALARAAAPVALSHGDLDTWRKLVGLGMRSARAGKHAEDLTYFLTEEHTSALLRGDRVAAAGALAALALELGRIGARPLPQPVQPIRPRRTLRDLRHALKARYGAGGGALVFAVAGLGAVAVIAGAAAGGAVAGRGMAAVPAPASARAPQGLPVVSPAFPDTISVQDSEQDVTSPVPFDLSVDYPSVSGLSDATVEKLINTEIRAPIQDEMNRFGPTAAAAAYAADPVGHSSQGIGVVTFQSGNLLSIEYTSGFYPTSFASQGIASDNDYYIEALTVRLDTGAVIPNADLLTPAATGADAGRLQTELENLQGIEVNQDGEGLSPGDAVSSLLNKGGSGCAMAVTPIGIYFHFYRSSDNGNDSDPQGVLSWSQLTGLVNPQIEQLVMGDVAPEPTASSGPTPPLPSTTPLPTATASASPTPSSPAAVVQAYIAAINAGDYQQAWALGGDHLGGSYSAFAAGFSGTKQDTLTVESVSGDTVTATLTALHDDGSQTTYQGTYTVTGGMIIGADLKLKD